MGQPIELRFKYTESEYVSAYRKYFLAKWRAMFFFLMAAGLIVIGFYFVIAKWDVTFSVSFIGTGAFLLGLLITSSFLLPRQRFRNDPRFKSEYLLRFSDEGIEFHTDEIDAKVSWRIYREIGENKNSIFYLTVRLR